MGKKRTVAPKEVLCPYCEQHLDPQMDTCLAKALADLTEARRFWMYLFGDIAVCVEGKTFMTSSKVACARARAEARRRWGEEEAERLFPNKS